MNIAIADLNSGMKELLIPFVSCLTTKLSGGPQATTVVYGGKACAVARPLQCYVR